MFDVAVWVMRPGTASDPGMNQAVQVEAALRLVSIAASLDKYKGTVRICKRDKERVMGMLAGRPRTGQLISLKLP